ncbi:hypothetical protein [Enterococcus sp. CSURQ0835]|uniref:hypothetical protein n=1 Tax=Enterococcus sp. CSURQ0835 TaxID=2681394 RepID=UPI00135CA2C3|nr:hypothetical protein [Enterococcus sp. CSURQ0835]
MLGAIILATVLLYGVNMYVFLVYFKEKQIENGVDKLAVLFGTNMTVGFIDALILFGGSLIEEGLALMSIF